MDFLPLEQVFPAPKAEPPVLLRPGDVFYENINQGDRHCTVLAVDDAGRVLYEYEMPAGRVFLRIDGKPISRKALPKKWQKLIETQ